MASNDFNQRKLPAEAPFRSWSFLIITLMSLGCISVDSVIVWKYPTSSASFFGDVLVMALILGSWTTAFQYHKKAHKLDREWNMSGLAMEKANPEVESNSVLDEALSSANRAIDSVLFNMSMAILVLLVEVLFPLMRR